MNSTERVIEMLEHRGIREPLILDAVHAINREFFLEGAERDPSPEVLGRMLQAMKLDEGGRLLQIGTGSGYAAAILSRIADEVFTTENDPDTLRRFASKTSPSTTSRSSTVTASRITPSTRLMTAS